MAIRMRCSCTLQVGDSHRDGTGKFRMGMKVGRSFETMVMVEDEWRRVEASEARGVTAKRENPGNEAHGTSSEVPTSNSVP